MMAAEAAMMGKCLIYDLAGVIGVFRHRVTDGILGMGWMGGTT